MSIFLEPFRSQLINPVTEADLQNAIEIRDHLKFVLATAVLSEEIESASLRLRIAMSLVCAVRNELIDWESEERDQRARDPEYGKYLYPIDEVSSYV
jgi:hypothetical protein